MQFPKINNCPKNFAIKLRGLSSAIYPVHFFLMLHRAPSCSGGAVQAVEEWCQFSHKASAPDFSAKCGKFFQKK